MPVTRRNMILGLLGATLLPTRAAATATRTMGGPAFGSSWRIVVESGTDLGAIAPLIIREIDETDRQMSPFRAASDLSRFNATQSTDWQEMPRNICEVTAKALQVSRQTKGAFDPTLGPLTARYGFGPISGKPGHPSNIRTDGSALKKSDPVLTLDLCAIAKGYALDRIIGLLGDREIQNALVEIGGEVRTLGRHPHGRAWRVAIPDPTRPDFHAHRIVAPGMSALATSGHVSNGVVGPLGVSHIIDPHRAKPALTRLLSVSTLAATA